MNKADEMSEDRREALQDPLADHAALGIGPRIAHYWGDASRQFMLIGAALLLLASPLYGENLRAEFPYEVTFALITVGFAALTSPRERWAAFFDSVISAVGAAMYAIWAIGHFSASDPIAFVLRMAISIVFLFAFYFSMKTVRAFSLSQIGRSDTFADFDEVRAHEDSVADEEKLLDKEFRGKDRF